MKPGFCTLVGWASFAVLICVPAIGVTQEQVIDVWPNGLPVDAKPLEPERIQELKKKNSSTRIAIVESPTLTVYPAPRDKSNGCGVVVCPGGGYNMLALGHEGTEIAKWFNSIGVTAFVLKYRVPRRDPNRIHWEPMQDVQRAIRIVRSQAKKWKVDPDRIGVLGFSAGGHLTVMAGVQYNTKSYPRVDEIDDVSCRPNFVCPIYAAYLADGYKDDVVELGKLVTVTKDSPPAFLAVTWDDKMRGAQSALLFAELKKHQVPAEIHVYTKGGHGYGIRSSNHPVSNWKTNLFDWLQSMKFLEPNRSDKK